MKCDKSMLFVVQNLALPSKEEIDLMIQVGKQLLF